MSSGEVVWDCKGRWLGLDTSVLLSNRDCGVPATISVVFLQQALCCDGWTQTAWPRHMLHMWCWSCTLKPGLSLPLGREWHLPLHLVSDHHKHRRGHVIVCTHHRITWGQLGSPAQYPLYMMFGLFTVHTGIASGKVKLGQASYCVPLAHKYLRYVA